MSYLKNNRLYKLVIPPSVFLLFFTLSSCEKLFIEANPKNTPTENVKYLWNVINEKYPFFEYKKINWDSVGKVWIPRASDSMSDVTTFRIMDSMLYALKDGHTNLYGYFNFSRNWEWYLNYPDNFNANVIERNYMKGAQWYTGPFIHRALDSNRVGYVRYSSFSNTISDFDIDVIVNRYQNLKGLIIDLRNNGGGAVSNVSKLMSRFIDKKTLVWKEAEKNGTGRNDFTDYKDEYVDPEGDKKFLKPIVILTNRRCYSATTLFVAAMLNLSNVKTIGDWTGGGGGTPTSTQLPNGWVVRYSGTVTLMPNNFNIENGIPPTIKQDISKTDEANGVDSILERALAEFR